MDLIPLLEERLGDRVEPGDSTTTGPMLHVGQRWLRYETKHYPMLRLPDIEAQLAWLSVELRRMKTEVDGALFLAEIPSLKPAHLVRLRDFLVHCHPRPEVALFSRHGGHVLSLVDPNRDEWDADPATSKDTATAANATSTRWSWSDHHQWLLSTLAFQHIEMSAWNGPRGPWNNVADWAHSCNVSTPVAYRCIAGMKQRAWVSGRKSWPVTLLEPRRVAQSWLEWARNSEEQRIAVRAVHGTISRDWMRHHLVLRQHDGDQQSSSRRGGRCALSGWHAIKAHDRLFVNEIPPQPEIAVEGNPASWIDRWHLVPCDERDAQAYLMLTRPSLSRFGAMAEKHGIATVDAWAAALSVVADPRRGLEQAEAIADEMWAP